MRPEDLTRWNRAGLSRFRYVDGNAITYLERLREALAEAYTGPGDPLPRWTDLVTRHPVQADETRAEREERLIAQYEAERRDHAWEILRAFARSAHVLTEHLDAYSNETFIGTATQWESLRRLVQMLDARPAPPASARTDLAFDAKVAGTLSAGFAVKNAPTDGSPPAIFETVDDLDVDPALNLIRPTDWDRSQIDFTYSATADGHMATFPLSDPANPPTVGEIAVLRILAADGLSEPTAYGVQVCQSLGSSIVLLGQETDDGSDLTVKRWRVSLHGGAELVQTPRLAGPDVVILTPEHNLAAGRSTVTWYDGDWLTARVMEVDGTRVRLDGTDYPAEGEDLYLMATAKTQLIDGIEKVIIPFDRGGGGKVWSTSFTDKTGSIQEQEDSKDDGTEFVVYQYVSDVDAVLYVPGASDPIARVEAAAPTDLVLGGTVEDVKQGDWIVSAGATLQAVRVDAVTEQDGDTAIDTTPAVADLQAPVHLKFKSDYFPLERLMNREPAFDDTARSDRVTRLFVDPADWPDVLAPGRAVIVETDGLAHSGILTDVDAEAGTIELSPVIPGTELTEPSDAPPLERWNTQVYANVVTADHGETQPKKILGSGNATRSNQVFEQKTSELSFVTDPMMPAGVRAAIDILVGERQWTQVGNLRDSGQTDAHFEVRVTEDGPVRIQFGDGRHGRRLPTGTDNVRIVWRKGVGEAGNVDAGSLVKIVQPDPLIAAVHQPIAAAGGAATEGVASLRENSAAGLLTLNRAVSVSDFGKLATQNASVLQAISFSDTAGGARGETVSVVVVPAGGRMGTLADDLTVFLQNHAVPGVTIHVSAYTPLPLDLDITLRIRSDEYNPDAVTKAVEAAIVEAHDLKRARLGAALFRSQILHLIESVEGVENAVATILTDQWTVDPAPLVNRSPGGVVRSVRPHPNQMIHYDADASTLSIRTEEYSP